MDIKLYDYQDKFYNDILEALEKHNSVCAVLPTGGGKSVVIGKLANNLKGRTLVLTHRAEILEQNSNWLHKVAILNSKENTIRYDTEIVIAMVQTLYSRIENYGIDYIGDFDNIILDEVHIDIFEKVFTKYNYKKLIGFTGTPSMNKNMYFEENGVEYVEPMTLSMTFEVLVEGPSTGDLIKLGKLVQDYNIVLELPDFDKLKESDTQPDGYTAKSLNEVYSNTASLNILWKAYEEHCAGKKTIMYNANNKINLITYNFFKEKGCNVKMFDTSKNREINPETGKKYRRDEIVEWFRNEKDAILINTNVFTIGFDVDDIECVIVNRATKSLSLWIQMVGRGSRTTTKIYKDFFKVIDLGQNIYEHGMWSSDVNWEEHFYSPGPSLRRSLDMLRTWECLNCGGLNVVGEPLCDMCGAPRVIERKEDDGKKLKEGELRAINIMPIPKGDSIVNYCEKINENKSFAFKLAEKRIIELFIFYNVSEEFYRRKKNEFDSRVKNIFRPIYFAITRSSLPGSSKRRLETMNDRIITKINKRMNYD